MRLIRADGTSDEIHADIPGICKALGTDTLDTVLLRHLGEPLQVMLVVDDGHARNLPINQRASELYLANCVPGTTHRIRGDVVVTYDHFFDSESQT